MIDGTTCKFCPGGVGGVVLSGTLCIFPLLFKEILSKLTGKELKFTLPSKLIKKMGYCITQFEIN